MQGRDELFDFALALVARSLEERRVVFVRQVP